GPILACGECDVCRRGRPAVCPHARRYGVDIDGTLASHVVARARWALAVDGALAAAGAGPEACAIGREAALAYEMWARAGVAPGETTIWLGGDAVARLGAAICAAKGAAAVVVGDDERGLADDALATSLRARAGAPPWRVFETSGGTGSRRRALALAAGA